MRQEILEMILNKPNVRTVEIADKLDMEPERVRPLIESLIKSGAIVEEPVIAPNGRTVLSFRYANAAPAAEVVTEFTANPFPARVIRALPPSERPSLAAQKPMGKPAPAGPAKPATDPLTLALKPAHVVAPELVTAEPLEIDVPVTVKAGAPRFVAVPDAPGLPKVYGTPSGPKTRVDMALNYLHAAKGVPVTSGELGKAMGLPIHHYPTSYLKLALKEDRVRRGAEPKTWVLGPVELAKVADLTGWYGLEAPAQVDAECPPVDPVSAARACVDGLAPDCECSNCATVALLETALAESAAPAPVEPAVDTPAFVPVAAVASVVPAPLAIPSLSAADPSMFASVPRIKTPFVPKSPDLDISRPGVYENGEFQRPHFKPFAIPSFGMGAIPSNNGYIGHNGGGFLMAANDVRAPQSFYMLDESIGKSFTMPEEKFVAGVMSDGSLELRVPGKGNVVLSAEHARELYLFVRTMGYAAWPTAA